MQSVQESLVKRFFYFLMPYVAVATSILKLSPDLIFALYVTNKGATIWDNFIKYMCEHSIFHNIFFGTEPRTRPNTSMPN